MKKIITMSLLSILCILIFWGCSKNATEENANIKDYIDNNEKADNDVDKENGINNASSFIKINPNLVSNNNQYIFTSNIKIEEDKATQSYKIDQQILQELENGQYTLEEPLIILNPFGNSPLTAVVLFQTKEEYAVRVTVLGNTDETDVVGNVNVASIHRVPVIGLYPDKENEVKIELLDKSDKVKEEKILMIETDPLPTTMENLVEVKKYTKPAAYGLIQVSGFGTVHPFAFDTEGNVRWYLSETYASYGYFPLSNNRFVIMDSDVHIQTYEKYHAQQLYEMDYLGRVHQVYLTQHGAHHEVIEKTPGGNLLILSNSLDGHVEDVVEEIDRNTGEIVKSLDMREIFGDTYVDMIDWAHLNTVSYVEKDDCIILSPRNIHSGIKVNWTTNELVWILANPKFWEGTPFEDKVLEPKGDDIIWLYQPHSIYELEEDLDGDPNTIHVMLFDNHWHNTRRVDFFDGLKSSFVSIFDINEETMTVSQSKVYEGALSNITSNYRFNYEAGRVFFMGGYLYKEPEGYNGMIYEFDYETQEPLNQYAFRYTFYRAYEFVPDFNSCATPMELDQNFWKGMLRLATRNENAEAAPTEITDKVSLSITQQILYVKAKDHTVSYIEFIGKNKSYIQDLSYITDGVQKKYKTSYKLTVPFSNLEPDEYQIVVTYEGVRYHTGNSITIKEN